MGLHEYSSKPQFTTNSSYNRHVNVRQMEQGCLVHVHCLPGEVLGLRHTVVQKQSSGRSVKLWAVFCWETQGLVIHMDHTLMVHMNLNVVTDQVHPPHGNGIYQWQ